MSWQQFKKIVKFALVVRKKHLRFHVFNLTLNLEKISETYMKAIEEYPE